MQQQQPAQTGQWSIPGPPQYGLHPYPPQYGLYPYLPMPQPPLVPSRHRPYPPEVYIHLYQQYVNTVHQAYGAPYPVPPPHHLGGYPPAFQGMGVPPAAAPPNNHSAPPSVQPSYTQHLEQGPEQQAPVAAAEESTVKHGKRKAVDLDQQAPVAVIEESAVKRGKRKAVDLDDDDAPPRKKQAIHPLLYHPDFELVQSNGEVRYKCCLPQCENSAAVRQAGIQGHIKSKKHQKVRAWFLSPECDEGVSRGDSSNMGDSSSKNQQETDKVSCEGSTSNEPLERFSNSLEETADLTSSEPLDKPVNSLDETVDSAWDMQLEEFFSIIEQAANSASGEQMEEVVNNLEETADSTSGEQLEFVNSLEATLDSGLLTKTDNSASNESSEDFINSAGETVDSASGEQSEEFVNSLDQIDDSAPDDLFDYCINNVGETVDSASGEQLEEFVSSLDQTDDSAPDDLFDYCINNLDKPYNSTSGESLDDLLNRLLASQAS